MIIFFMIVGFGIVFYTQLATDNARRVGTEVTRANLAEAAKIVSSLPELHCSLDGDGDLTCIDVLRAEVFSAQVLDGPQRLHYSEALHNFKASVQCIYPSPCSAAGISDFSLFDYTDPKAESEEEFVIPITLQNPYTGQNGYGLLIIVGVS